MNREDISIAALTDDTLTKVRDMERDLCQETNEEIILIAYKNGGVSAEGR